MLARLPEFQAASVVKCNPDTPQVSRRQGRLCACALRAAAAAACIIDDDDGDDATAAGCLAVLSPAGPDRPASLLNPSPHCTYLVLLQKQVRYNVLAGGKTLLTPQPRLRTGFFSTLRKDTLPADALREACTSGRCAGVGLGFCARAPSPARSLLTSPLRLPGPALVPPAGVAKHGTPVSLDDKVKVDLIVVGSVAVDPQTGCRCVSVWVGTAACCWCSLLPLAPPRRLLLGGAANGLPALPYLPAGWARGRALLSWSTASSSEGVSKSQAKEWVGLPPQQPGLRSS